jgi:hypothetical protein
MRPADSAVSGCVPAANEAAGTAQAVSPAHDGDARSYSRSNEVLRHFLTGQRRLRVDAANGLFARTWKAAVATGVLAVALTACGSSGSTAASSSTSTTGTAAGATASRAAFDACLSKHGVTLPNFAGGAPGGGAPAGGTGAAAGGTGSRGGFPGGFGGGGGRGFASNPKFAAAFKACASLRPAGGFGGFGGGGGGTESAAVKAYSNCLKLYGFALPAGRFGSGSGSSSTSTTVPKGGFKLTAKDKLALTKCAALRPKGFGGRGPGAGSSTTTTTVAG